jgi:hypothetical protein
VLLAQCGHTGEKRPVMTMSACFRLFVCMRYGVTKNLVLALGRVGTSDLFLKTRFVLSQIYGLVT